MKKLIAILAVTFALAANSLSAEWPGIATGWHEVQVPASGVFDPSTGTFFAPTITGHNLSLTSLATPSVTSVTPTLTRIGSITTVAGGWRATGLMTVVAKANLVDGETFVLSDGTNIPQSFEFDVAGDGVTGGRVAVDVSAATTALDVAVVAAAAINATTSATFTYEAIDNLDGTITLRNTTWLASGTTLQSETVVDAGFILTNMTGGADGVADGDYFTVKYDVGLTIPIEFDASPGNGTSGGRIPLVFTGTDTADQIRDAIIVLLNTAAPTALTASSGGAATVAITLDVPGNAGDTNTENVADAGFAVTGFSVTAATTYGYKVVSFLADGTSTAASPEVTTVAGHATLSATNYNTIVVAPSVGSSYSKVYRTTGGAAPPKLLYSGSYVVLVDNGIAGTAETPASTNTTGALTVDSLTSGRVPIVGTAGLVTDDAGLTYDAATDTLTVGAAGVIRNGIDTWSAGYTAGSGDYGLHLANFAQLTWATGVGASGAVGSGLRRVSPGLVGVTSGGSNLGSLQAGNYTAVALGTPTVTSPLTVNGTPGSTTYGYKAVAFLNDGTSSAASAEVTIATGPAALNGTDNITVAVPAVTGMAYMNIYRTTGGAAPPKLIYSGTSPSYIDTGTEISASTPPATNTTGRVLVGDGSVTVPSVAAISEPGTGLFIAAGDLNIVSAYGKVNVRTAAVNLDSDRDYRIANDTFLTRADAATWQMGRAPRATPLANTLIVGESGSGTDIAGANGVIQSGAGTGAGAGSSLFLQTPVNHGSDAVAQTQTTRMSMSQYGVTVDAVPLFGPAASDQIDLGFGSNAWRHAYLSRATLGSKTKTLTDASATDFATIALADGTMTGGEIIYRVTATIAGEKQNLSGRVRYSAIRDNTDYDCDISEVGTQTTSLKSGTLAGSITCAAAAGVLTFSANFDSSLTAPTVTIHYRFDSTDAATAITPL